MRTSYNRENNKDSNNIVEKDKQNALTQELKTNEDSTSEIPKDGVSVDKILNALENKSVEEVNLGFSENEEFDLIFSDGKVDAVTTDFYKISDEIDEALEEDRLSRIEDSHCEFEDKNIDLVDLDEGIDLDKDTNEEGIDNEDIVEKHYLKKDKEGYKFNTKKIIIGTASAVAIIAGVSFGYKAINNRNSIEGLERQISKLYTSSKKDDLKNNVDSSKIDKYYTRLENLGSNEDTDNIRLELDSISAYIADRGILDDINSSSYDFNSSDMQSKLDKVNISSLNYSVPSLTDSISATIRQITEDYNYFIALRDELSLVSDYSNFDVKAYQLKINEVSHTVNKKELQDKLDSISKSIKLSETVEDIKNESSQKIDEAVDKVSTSFGEKLSEISENIKEIVPNIINAIKDFFSGDESQGN